MRVSNHIMHLSWKADPEVVKKVDQLFAKGGALHGKIKGM